MKRAVKYNGNDKIIMENLKEMTKRNKRKKTKLPKRTTLPKEIN